MLNILLSLRLHQPTHRRVGTGRVLPLFAITGWLRISGMRWVRISGTHNRPVRCHQDRQLGYQPLGFKARIGLLRTLGQLGTGRLMPECGFTPRTRHSVRSASHKMEARSVLSKGISATTLRDQVLGSPLTAISGGAD